MSRKFYLLDWDWKYAKEFKSKKDLEKHLNCCPCLPDPLVIIAGVLLSCEIETQRCVVVRSSSVGDPLIECSEKDETAE